MLDAVELGADGQLGRVEPDAIGLVGQQTRHQGLAVGVGAGQYPALKAHANVGIAGDFHQRKALFTAKEKTEQEGVLVQLQDKEKQLKDQLEQKKRELEEKLNSGIADHNELQSISEQIKNIVNELDQKSSRWLELSEVVI